MKIYLYANRQVNVFYLPENISGSYSFDVDNDEVSKLINVDSRDGKWILFETPDCKLLVGKAFVKETVLEQNNFYVLVRDNIKYLIYVEANDDKDIKAYNYSTTFNLTIGENGTMTYNCPYASNFAISIIGQEDGKILLNLSQGEAFINKKLISRPSIYLNSGDELELLGARILFLGKMIVVIAADNILQINANNAKLFPTKLGVPEELENLEIKDKELYADDDYYSKAPRLRRTIENKEIELSDPPPEEKEQEVPMILTIGPMATMGVSSVVTLASSISKLASGEVDFSNVAGQLIVGVTMLISTLLWPILTNHYNKKLRIRTNQRNTEKYKKYLEEKKVELETERKLQQEIIKENVISLNDCIENLKHRKLNFWDKRMDQSDFLVARIGVGNELLKATINYPKKGFSLDESELKAQVDQMAEDYKYIENVPIGYSFYENNITAVMGEVEKSHHFMNNILFQLLTFYSYDDLKIVIFTNEKNKNYWNYVKYLNHNMTNDSAFRFFASNEDSASLVVDVLKREFNVRLEASGDNETVLFKPYYFVIVDDIDILKKTNFIESITEIRKNIGFSLVILEKKLSKLPSLCNNFINLGDTTSGVLKNSYEKQEQIIFKDEVNPNVNMMEAAKILANIPIEISATDESSGELPDAITFLEMAKVGKVEQLNIMNRWDTNDSTANLKAEVGVGTDGKLLYLDLHEKAHGPHGLIAGMTGSGKSEFIITWILSLAMNFSPEDVAFILIDYKGGGLAFAFENQVTGVRLPHLTGTITNLDKAEINRTLVSIDSEVKRRQQIFNEARDKLGQSTIDIYKYQAFYHDGKLSEPLPHLFIVCDEFAELKAQQPDFMDNLISVARIGRSLGVHLILATQKPSGVVNDQIWSNTKFRVCLKVQDASDSNEMLKRPDAAGLKQTGRFYLQVGYDEYFVLGQSGWCGAKYYPSDVLQKTVDKSVNIIDETGIVIKNIQTGTSSAKSSEAQGEQLAAIMNEIIKVATDSNRFAKRLWLENIKPDITIEEVESKYKFEYQKNNFDIVIGEYDAPESQSQAPLIYNVINDGNTNIVGTDSGESEEIISTMLFNIMKHFLPNEISYYIIDYGSQNFMKFKKAPHCGGVVSPTDTEEYESLFKLLSEEQKERKKILSDFGSSYLDYVKENPGKMPIMLVIFNNYESINESNDSLYEIMGNYLRDSERYGIVYIFTSSGVGGVPEKFKQLLNYSLAFKLKDPLDYSVLFNAKDKMEPRDLFGRGICLNEKLHEFQVAFIAKEKKDSNAAINSLIKELTDKQVAPAVRIPSLPEQVELNDVAKKLKSMKKIPVGINTKTLDIMTYDLTIETGKLVLSPKIKYLKSFAKSFIDEIMYLKANIMIIDAIEAIPEIKEKTANYFTSDFDNKIDKIMEFADKHNSGSNNVLIIYSLSKLMGKLENKTKIEELFEKFKALDNSFVIIFDESAKIREYAYETWYKAIDVSEGVYIGPGVEDQNIFKINNYSRELSQAQPKNYGYYIAEGSCKPIKLIEFERIEDDDDDEE